MAKAKKTHGEKKRNILFAPWRLGYLKSGAKPRSKNGCVFCEAVKIGEGMESLILFKGKKNSVILNKFPYNNGHVMVIPHRHLADMDKLTPTEFTEMHALLKKTQSVLFKAYNPQGLNIGLNLGRVAGAGITDHMHYHLIPRWGGDNNFMPVIAGTRVITESLEDTFDRLKPYFRKRK